MSANKYAPHLYVIPEDDANRQIAIGFEKDPRIKARSIQIVAPAGGWRKALDKLAEDYYRILESNHNSRVLVIIDCDNDSARIDDALLAVPENLRERVFIVGTLSEPEILKSNLKTTFERIGEAVASDCFDQEPVMWNHEQLRHNSAELERLKADLFNVVFDV